MANGFTYDMTGLQDFPEAFDVNFLPEWKVDPETGEQDPKEFQKAMMDLEQYIDDTHQYLKSDRAKHEATWELARKYYEMSSDGKFDANRLASVYTSQENNTDQELDKERASIIMPICFEAEQQIASRVKKSMWGPGPNYVEINPRGGEDQPAADAAQEILNYQHYSLIPTDNIADDVINSSIVEGTGIIACDWSPELNAPKNEVVDIRDYWMDPVGDDHQEDRWNIWRMYMTVGQLKALREQGVFWFNDADLESALPSSTTSGSQDNKAYENKDRVGERESDKIVTLDIFMQRDPERYVYRINESLVIGIIGNPILSDSNRFRYPTAIYSPVREFKSKYGRSIIAMMLDSQDMANSLLYMMCGNIARTSLGLIFGDPTAFDGSDLQVGEVIPVDDPARNVYIANLPDTSASSINAIEYVRREISDKTSGVTESARGQQQSANQTASSVNQLANEAASRIDAMIQRGRSFMRNYFSLNLIQNQLNLSEQDAIMIKGNDDLWRPMGGADLFGVVGRDIMPTGYPVAGSRTYEAQNGMNTVGVLLQMRDRGLNIDPMPVLRRTLAAQGYTDVDSIIGEDNPIGSDPLQENDYMRQGISQEVSPEDNPQYHLQAHFFLLQDPQVLDLMNQDPQYFQTIVGHIQQHQMQLQQLMGQQQAQQTGGTGLPGQNSNPAGAPDPKQAGEVEAQNNSFRNGKGGNQ